MTIYVGGVYATHFWYDNRDDHWSKNSECISPSNVSLDMSVRYDVDENKLYYDDQHNSEYDPNNPDPLEIGFIELRIGETINWWEVMELTHSIDDFLERYFAVLNEPTRVNNTPYLTWEAPNVSEEIDYYKVERAWGENGFGTIATTTNTNYLDYEIFWGTGGNTQFIQYRVLTVYEDEYIPQDYSNTQKLMVSPDLQKQKSHSNELANFNYELYQNFPNPFNPSTRIEFELPKDGFVNLKVFDILGRELETLVDAYKNKGKYTVEFNANNLSTGIYFYEIRSNEFVVRRKMILMK